MRVQVLSEESGFQEYLVDQSTVTIGRGGSADITLDSDEISRIHVAIQRAPKTWSIEDRSTNGTFIDGHRVRESTELPAGTEFTIGPYTIWFGADGDDSVGRVARVTELRKSLHRQLLGALDLHKLDLSQIADGTVREEAKRVLDELVHERADEIPSHITPGQLVKDVLDEALGLGPLQNLLRDEETTEIMVVARNQIYVERHGKIEKTNLTFTTDESLKAIIERIVAPLGRHIDEGSPLVDARLKDGSRVNAVIPPIALKGPCLTIRKFRAEPLSVQELVDYGSITPDVVRFLERCVIGKRNAVISGGTGSGKTTLLNVLSSFIPSNERVVTVEDAAELRLNQEHVVSLEGRPANAEGKGQVTIRDLVKNALRMRPDRIVVGECRGGEALDMLQAMNTGHEGSLTTAHANTPKDLLSRLEMMVLSAGVELPVRVVREQMTAALDIIVQIRRFPNGARRVTHVTEVLGMEDGVIYVEDVFRYELGLAVGDEPGQMVRTGYIPSFIAELVETGVIADGIFL